MKNPNGYGSVVKLSGNRRKPFAVRKTTGWNEKGHPIYDTIGYCVTREEGNILLADYNKSPWDIDKAKITMIELFELWKEKKMPKEGKSNQSSLRSAFNHCTKYQNMKYKEIKSYHMQDCIDGCGRGYSTQAAIKNLWGHLDRFAMELDIVSKCYSDLLTSDPIPDTTRDRFSDKQIELLWKVYAKTRTNQHEYSEVIVEWIDSVLIFIYSGFRISELLGLLNEKTDMIQGTFQGGVKTKAGKERIVPVHSLIKDMVQKRYDAGDEFLFGYNGKQMSNSQYYLIWNEIMDKLKIKKTPHECRHTFESLLDSAGANRKCIDLMMGHKSKDTGNRVYNHKTLEELKSAIELIGLPKKAA